jgi:predicted nucleic acid-binding protein
MIVVADASPLIALSRIGKLELLRQLFGRLLVPQAVWQEVALADSHRAGVQELLNADWVEQRQVVDVALVRLLRRDLGAGESEAIVLAREVKADVLLIDERLGRSAAARLGLPMTGLVGILIEARRQGLLPDATSVIHQLRHEAGFWISDRLAALVEAKEV